MICWHCETRNDILDEVIGTCRACMGDLFVDPDDVARIKAAYEKDYGDE